ncbi:MAG TPA: MCE family protein [Nocardioides sp.]|nr:MCE family protein [Nocardioides sp.]
MRQPLRIVTAGILATLLTSCTFDGIDQVALPGGTGTGDDAIHLTVELPDVGTLTPNAQVKVGDIAVGTVTSITAVDWHAEARLSLEPDVDLPANALASVGVNTLLGAAYVELAAPPHPRGHLADGDRVPLARGHAYPSTEQVLSAASLALNGGGLEQLSTITTELNHVLGGNDRAVADLLPRLDSFIGTLDDQKSDILGAVRDVATLSRRFAGERHVISDALDQIGPALRTLAENRPDITKALTSLAGLGDVATPLVQGVHDDLVANLQDIQPALAALSRAGDAAVSALGFALTFPFAPETVGNACRGDYCNLDLTLDLTNQALVNGFTTPDGSLGIPGFPGLDVDHLLSVLTGGAVPGVTGLLTGLTGRVSNESSAEGGLAALLGGS